MLDQIPYFLSVRIQTKRIVYQIPDDYLEDDCIETKQFSVYKTPF